MNGNTGAESEVPQILLHNGVEKHRGTYNECLVWMQRHTSQSWSHEMKYNGWKIAPMAPKLSPAEESILTGTETQKQMAREFVHSMRTTIK